MENQPESPRALTTARRSLNILVVGPFPPRPGGTAASLLQLTAELARRHHTIRVLAPITAETAAFDGPFRRSLARVCLTRYVVPYYLYDHSTMPWDEHYRSREAEAIDDLLPRLILQERPDIIVAGQEPLSWYVPRIARAHGIPCVLLLRGGPTWKIVDGSFPPPDLQIWLEKFRSADWIVAVARYFERGLRQLGLTNISSIPNHVDLTRFAPAPKDPRLLRVLGVTGDDIIVLHASKMVPRKRPLDIVAAAAGTVRRSARMRYIVAGEGAESQHMEEACDRLRVTDHFRFLGWVPYERMPSLFNLADIVVHPSEGEGLARVYLEAMACGRLLVASDIPAAREVVRHMETGLLFRKGDVGQLTAALLASQDAEVRATLGRAARGSVEVHSLQTVADQYVRVFHRVIAGEREAHIVQP